MVRLMFSLLCLLLFAGGCASTGEKSMQLEPGMSKAQVIATLGDPADRSFRGTDEALQYQEIVGFGQCKYTTVWLRDGELVGVTSRRGSSVAGCGLGSEEVDWAEMPGDP